jgi:hypothetical protein
LRSLVSGKKTSLSVTPATAAQEAVKLPSLVLFVLLLLLLTLLMELSLVGPEEPLNSSRGECPGGGP